VAMLPMEGKTKARSPGASSGIGCAIAKLFADDVSPASPKRLYLNSQAHKPRKWKTGGEAHGPLRGPSCRSYSLRARPTSSRPSYGRIRGDGSAAGLFVGSRTPPGRRARLADVTEDPFDHVFG